jgi:predicted transposase YdaD
VYQEAREEGEQWGRRQEAASLVLRQLTRRLKQELSEQMRSQIDALSLTQLEELAEALLDFSAMSDWEAWLAQQE